LYLVGHPDIVARLVDKRVYREHVALGSVENKVGRHQHEVRELVALTTETCKQ
jgi:hypothetical protein